MYFAIACGVLGAIVGSFLNVAILRKGIQSIGGRSACLSCEARLRWYDMIPVLSWFALRGRCRSCGSSISIQYPIVEMATAVLFALLALSTPLQNLPELALGCIAASLLVAIAAYDLRHTIIPDSWAYGFASVSLAYMLAGDAQDGTFLLHALAGPIAALPIAVLWFISGGRWIGLGDAKLSLGIGWLLGPVYGIGAVFFAFVIGAVVSVGILMPLPFILRALQRAGKGGIARFRRTVPRLTMKSEVPFGPFLVASCLIVWFSLLFELPLPW